jgi:hypothetical protein
VARKLGITKTKILEALWENAQKCLRGAQIFDKNGKPTGEFGKPDSAGANRALQLIGMEAYGMFTERHEIGGPGDFARLTDDELFARVQTEAAALGLSADATEQLLLTFQKGEEPEDEPR